MVVGVAPALLMIGTGFDSAKKGKEIIKLFRTLDRGAYLGQQGYAGFESMNLRGNLKSNYNAMETTMSSTIAGKTGFIALSAKLRIKKIERT